MKGRKWYSLKKDFSLPGRRYINIIFMKRTSLIKQNFKKSKKHIHV